MPIPSILLDEIFTTNIMNMILLHMTFNNTCITSVTLYLILLLCEIELKIDTINLNIILLLITVPYSVFEGIKKK